MTTPQLFNNKNWVEQSETLLLSESQQFEKDWLNAFLLSDSSTYIHNVETEVQVIWNGAHFFPMTINDTEYGNSYVCSPYTHNVSYALEELHNLECKPLEYLCAGILLLLGRLLQWGKINQTIHVNNWMLSTNLYPDWNGDTIPEITQLLMQQWPEHAIVFRSLNQAQHENILTVLNQCGYEALLTRQVYLFDGKKADYLKKTNTKRDRQLLEKSHYIWVPPEELKPSDFKRIVELYDQLYLEKYSQHNPKFTEALVRYCWKKGIWQIHGLRHPDGHLDGVLGYFVRDGVMTTPLVGYDTSLPQSVGLYRMVIMMVLLEAERLGITLNLSAGAAHFKRLRGGVAALEYSALYIQHLPWYRQWAWRCIMMLMNTVGVAIMKRYQL